MKKQMLNVVVTLSIIVTLAVAGFAALGGKLEAKVPFDFNVNGKTLPAGEYTIEPSTNGSLLMIRNWKTGQAAASIARATKDNNDGKPQLIFRRYGQQYFLAQVISPTRVNELMKSKAEREAARGNHLAQGGAAPEIVTISAQLGQ